MNPPSISPVEVPHLLTRDALCQILNHLRLGGREVLKNKNRAHIIQTLAGISKHWCSKTYSMRRKALELLPKNTGFSKEMIEKGLDLTFSKITAEVLTDYANSGLRKSFQPVSGLIGHIAPGNLFPPVVQSLFHGLLVQSPNFIRTSEHDLHFPVLLAQSLIDADLELAEAIAVAHWSSANMGLNKQLAQEVDTLVVYGSDQSLDEWRALLPAQKRFIGFGNRFSVGFISQSGLDQLDELAAHAALDTAMYDQQGCLSPHCFFLENPSFKQWIGFGTRLSEELYKLDKELPILSLPQDLEFVIGELRQKYLFKSSQQPEAIKIWFSKFSPWTVIFEDRPGFSPTCPGRTIRLRPVSSLLHMTEILKPWTGKLQCLGTDLTDDRTREHLSLLKNLGFTRICPIGHMQAPPITWPNGGCSLLKQLIT